MRRRRGSKIAIGHRGGEDKAESEGRTAGVPRRAKPDALSLALGARIRQLREEAGLTLERLAFESELGSKGHLSNIEHGLVRPTAHTLRTLSDRLGVELADMVTFPD